MLTPDFVKLSHNGASDAQASVYLYTYQCTKFQLSSSISFGDMKGSQYKEWELLISPDAPWRTIFLYWALVRVNAYKCAKFQLPSSITFRDKEGVPKFNVGLLAPCHTRTLKLLRVLKVLGKVKQHAKFQHRIYASCSYAVMYFPLAFHYMCPKMGFLGVKM